MTVEGSGLPPMSEVREAARDRARELRELHKKKDRRRRLIVTLSVVGGSLVIIAVVAIVLLSFTRSTGRGPQNMQSDGIKIGAEFAAVRTPSLASGETPIPSAANSAEVIDIKIYIDYLCSNCGTFEQRNADQIRAWVESGAATVEYHPIAVLTTKSAGTQYSLRAANAAACVAEYSPDHFFDFNAALFVDQPQEGSAGLDDRQLLDRAKKAGVTNLNSIKICIADQRFKSWVQDATARALSGPLPNADLEAVVATPTIIVNGEQFRYTSEFDPNEFAQFVVQAAGQSFTQNVAPTSGPSGSPTPTPSPTP
jgi:protein-disulfide isomerase